MKTLSFWLLPSAAGAAILTCAVAVGYPRPTRYNCYGGGLEGGRIVRVFPPVRVRRPDGFGGTGLVMLKGLVLPRIFDSARQRWRDPSSGWFARYRWVRQYEFASLSLTAGQRHRGKPTVRLSFEIPEEHLAGLTFQEFLQRWQHVRRAELLAIAQADRTVIPLRVFRPLRVGGRVWHLKLFRFTATISPRQALVFVRLPAWQMRIESRAHPNLHFPAFRIHDRQRRLLLKFFRRANLPTRWRAGKPRKHAPTGPATRP
ncbi:MAG: hypothetical protein HKL95_03220 [Phycisphaerae bacterium]|nr:hypothetical protein [Phycisphaerae bacterium]